MNLFNYFVTAALFLFVGNSYSYFTTSVEILKKINEIEYPHSILAVAINEDDRSQLVLSTNDGIMLYDWNKLEDIAPLASDVKATAITNILRDSKKFAYSVATNSDGALIVSGIVDENTIKEPKEQIEIPALKGANLNLIEWSPDGEQLIFKSLIKTGVTNFKNLHDIKAQYSSWLDNDRIIYNNGLDINSLNTSKGMGIAKMYTVPSKITALSYFKSKNLNYLVTALEGNNLIYRMIGKDVKPALGQHEKVNTIAFSPSGEKFATASNDGTIKIWDVVKETESTAFDASFNYKTRQKENIQIKYITWVNEDTLIALIGQNKLVVLKYEFPLKQREFYWIAPDPILKKSVGMQPSNRAGVIMSNNIVNATNRNLVIVSFPVFDSEGQIKKDGIQIRAIDKSRIQGNVMEENGVVKKLTTKEFVDTFNTLSGVLHLDKKLRIKG